MAPHFTLLSVVVWTINMWSFHGPGFSPHLLLRCHRQPHCTPFCCSNPPSSLLLQGLSMSCPLQLSPALHQTTATLPPGSPWSGEFSFRLFLSCITSLSSTALVIVSFVLFGSLLLGWLRFNSLSHLKAGSGHVSFDLESQMSSRFWLTEWIHKFNNQSINHSISLSNYWLVTGCSCQK